jgi:hypothetical protein
MFARYFAVIGIWIGIGFVMIGVGIVASATGTMESTSGILILLLSAALFGTLLVLYAGPREEGRTNRTKQE